MIDRKGIFSFLGITFVITYAIEGALIARGFRVLPGVASAGQYVIMAVMWVPALATAITVKLVTREGFGGANVRFGGWRPYVASGLILPACFIAIYAITWLLGLAQPDWSLGYLRGIMAGGGSLAPSMPPPAALFPGFFFATLVFAPFLNGLFGFGEELGWRGYLLPKLMPLGKPRAYLLLGIIWGLWHAPLVLVGFAYPGHPLIGIPMFMLVTTGFGIYLNEISLRHRSSVLAGWAHGVFNSQKLGVWAILFPGADPLLGGYAGAVGIAVWFILGLLQYRRSRARPVAGVAV